jgi:hypothetical protein
MKLTRVSVMKPDTFMRNNCENKNPKEQRKSLLASRDKATKGYRKRSLGDSKEGSFDRGLKVQLTENM